MTRTGAHNTQGKAQIEGGSIVLVGTSGSGRFGVSPRASTGSGRFGVSPRASTASVSERDGVLIMTGTGRDDIGPLDFEFTRRK